MFGFDVIKSPVQAVEIVVINNDNVIKEYQTIITNLTRESLDGKIKMFIASNDGKSILDQGPKQYHLNPVGSPINEKGGPQALLNWKYPIDDRFKPGIQYFVVFQAEIPGVNESFVQTFTSFFTLDEPEPLPTVSNPN